MPAVASALFLISGIIAGIPVRMYKREGNTIAEILDDERIKLLILFLAHMKQSKP